MLVAPAAAGAAGPSLVGPAAAVAKARTSGSPVTVTSLTTETQSAVANPNGTITMTFAAGPVRTRRANGSWVPIDTTLSVVNGVVTPNATTTSMRFSDGGTAPLATVTDGADSYSLTAPWKLPKPTISGSTATYMNVAPGVDLVVQALPDGFSDNLVVENAKAAQALVATPATFGVKTRGLRQTVDAASGTVNLRDGGGRTVLTGDAPAMWDSTGADPAVLSSIGSAGAAAAAVVHASTGAHVAPMVQHVTATSVSLAPSTSLLKAAGLTYPLVLDPKTVSESITGWTVMDSQYTTHAYWKDSPDPAGDLSVGYDGYVTGAVRRSAVQFNTSALAGKKILAATFTPYDAYSADCTAREMDLYRTSSISSATTWHSQPTWAAKVDSETFAYGHSASGSCGPKQQDFDATAAVVTTAAAASATTTLGLRATTAGESTLGDWKQLAPPGSSSPPVLSVTYLSEPTAPVAAMSSPSYSCSTSSTSPTWISTATPVLKATLVDADGSSSTLRGNFAVYAGTTLAWSGDSSGTVASGAAVTATTTTLAQSTLYYYEARTQYNWTKSAFKETGSGAEYSPWSTKCYFEINTTPPTPPTVTSTTYPQCTSSSCPTSPGVGGPGTFTLTGDANTQMFEYTLNSDTKVSVPAVLNGSTTSAPATIIPNQRGTNILQVTATNSAGISSTTYEYDFSVTQGSAPAGVWNLDDVAGTSAADSNTLDTQHPATLSSTYAWWDPYGRAGAGNLTFNGVNGQGQFVNTGYAATSTSVVNTSDSFAVSAWVNLWYSNTAQTMVSQSGTNTYGFSLGFDPSVGWVFRRTSADVASPTVTTATGPGTATLDVWTHLVGVYDSVAGIMRLYVNGSGGTAVPFTTPWTATGALNFARAGSANGGYTDYLDGHLDQVQVWNRVVAPQEISDMVAVTDPNTGLAVPELQRDWPVQATDGSTLTDTSGYNRPLYVAPNGVTILADDPTRDDVPTMQLNGTNGSGQDYDESVDAQGSFTATAWVNLSSAGLSTTGAQTATIMAQNGTNQATWSVGYQQTTGTDTGVWYFSRTSADTANPTTTTVTADATGDLDNWVMISIVYDAAAVGGPVMHLYINGIETPGSPVPFTTLPWQPTGSGKFSVGEILSGGTWQGYFPGSMDDITVSTGTTDQSTLITQWATQLSTP